MDTTKIEYSINYEQCYLSTLLQAIADKRIINTQLNASNFTDTNYGKIFEEIQKQVTDGLIPDIKTLSKELKGIVSASVIAEITNAPNSYENLLYYEEIIIQTGDDRVFIQALDTAKERINNNVPKSVIASDLITTLTKVMYNTRLIQEESITTLLEAQFPPTEWVVPNLIGQGLTLLNGAPKIGKSWIVLQLAIASGAGGKFLSCMDVKKTDTLYLALEDTKQLLQERLKKLNAPKLNNVKIHTQWKGGVMGLEGYLKNNGNIKLVIIDTLARFANIDDLNDYAKTTATMANLKRVADDLNIAILLIHHAKKMGKPSSGVDWMESALGSTGLTGATDTTIYISRNRENKDAILYSTGRKFEDLKLNLKLDLDQHIGWYSDENKNAKKNITISVEENLGNVFDKYKKGKNK